MYVHLAVSGIVLQAAGYIKLQLNACRILGVVIAKRIDASMLESGALDGLSGRDTLVAVHALAPSETTRCGVSDGNGFLTNVPRSYQTSEMLGFRRIARE